MGRTRESVPLILHTRQDAFTWRRKPSAYSILPDRDIIQKDQRIRPGGEIFNSFAHPIDILRIVEPQIRGVVPEDLGQCLIDGVSFLNIECLPGLVQESVVLVVVIEDPGKPLHPGIAVLGKG